MYIDGMSVGTANAANGSSGWAPQFEYTAATRIDSAAAWSRALSASEIFQVFQNPPPVVVYGYTLGIADDENPPLTFSSQSFWVSAEPVYDGSSLHVNVGVSNMNPSPVSVQVTFAGPADVLARLSQMSFVVTIPTWQTTAYVEIPITDDILSGPLSTKAIRCASMWAVILRWPEPTSMSKSRAPGTSLILRTAWTALTLHWTCE